MHSGKSPRKKLKSPTIEESINSKTTISECHSDDLMLKKEEKLPSIKKAAKRKRACSPPLTAGVYSTLDDFMPSTSTAINIKRPRKIKDEEFDRLPFSYIDEVCANVPECLFDTSAAKKHFTKFGRVQKIRMFPKRQICIVEYDQPMSVEKAVLNAGAYDGFMFDVTRYKPRVRRKSKKEEDPDWVPDSDVEKELSAMGATPIYRLSRQKPMDVEAAASEAKKITRVIKQSPRKVAAKRPVVSQPEPTLVVSATVNSMSTAEAASELHQLRSRVCLTPDEQWRLLDARDRILRAWGGAGARVKVGGATIGTCADMCPEKERLHRQAEHQVMTLETVPDSDGELEPWRAVKQYSRSSADQEIPMCYELRPAAVLMKTCAYMLYEVADTARQVALADWFHFMWDRFRGIRKDITQQNLCCADSITLVEICARFHAHCAARLADLEHTQFDQKLNTDNLTKCLQTLKYMYSDVGPDMKPREAEFRGYIALLNLGDSNFWWEIKQLPEVIQKSPDIMFAIKVFNALDNNNYVRFFRLVKEEATYLQACILLRYFNDVRARALARIVKAYAPRGGSKYPAEDFIKALCFESVEQLNYFITHYGLRFAKTDDLELCVILDRNQFIEDSDPFPLSRAVSLIESKRQCSVGEVTAGGQLPVKNYSENLYSSFSVNGTLKEAALIAEEQGYDTTNDSNKDVKALKSELQKLSQGRNISTERVETKGNFFAKPEIKPIGPAKNAFTMPQKTESPPKKQFLFKPAIPIAPVEVLKTSPEKVISDPKSIFAFTKPEETIPVIDQKVGLNHNVFGKKTEQSSIFRTQSVDGSKKIFSQTTNSSNIFAKSDNISAVPGNIFSKAAKETEFKQPASIFGAANKTNLFSKAVQDSQPNSIFTTNGDVAKVSPANIFKSAIVSTTNGPTGQNNAGFQGKDSSVAASIFNVKQTKNDPYDFNEDDKNDEEVDFSEQLQKLQDFNEQKKRKEEDRLKQEELKREEETRLEIKRKEDEAKRKEEEIRRLEEKRRKEEKRKQEELRKKLEEERQAELKRKAEEERKFKERVEIESLELIEELVNEIGEENVKSIMKDEIDNLQKLMLLAGKVTQDILNELCDEICRIEMKVEKFWTDKLMKKWFVQWRRQVYRNIKRRNLLDDTPVWLTEKTPIEEALCLRRSIENSALQSMNAFHRGYRFSGELKEIPPPEPYTIVEIIRSSLLKRMKQINYPYDKCYFWKLSLISPGVKKWIYKKIEIEKWLSDAFIDGKSHNETILQVGKHSWNRLMDFAISVSMASNDNKESFNEAIDGANGFIFYTTEKERYIIENIEDTLKYKYPYQVLPVAVILPQTEDTSLQDDLEKLLSNYVQNNVISAFKVFTLDAQNVASSLYSLTKVAMKWLAKKYPLLPPLEINYLKSICQQYLGSELWHRFRSERDSRMITLVKDLRNLIHCYNTAVDKLTQVITNDDHFNYPNFPLEFKKYLEETSPYPKPFEFISSSVKTSENVSAIKYFMQQLKLPTSASEFHPLSVEGMQHQIRSYCNQIGWFENPEEVVCKVIAVLPHELSSANLSYEEFNANFERYDLLDFLNILVCEKISRLRNFDNRFAIYERKTLDEYRNVNWLYDTTVMSKLKHKPLVYEDEVDYFIDAKRRKLELDSLDTLMLEDKDCTLVEENIKTTNESINKYNRCTEAVKKLEEKIEEEKQKSVALENLLRTALSNV